MIFPFEPSNVIVLTHLRFHVTFFPVAAEKNKVQSNKQQNNKQESFESVAQSHDGNAKAVTVSDIYTLCWVTN